MDAPEIIASTSEARAVGQQQQQQQQGQLQPQEEQQGLQQPLIKLDGLQDGPQAGQFQQLNLEMEQQQQQWQGQQPAKKPVPEQRRRCMSDRFMMFTYKIKLCKRQDPHNWRLCPYAHPGEAGKRRPPHAYQAVMCDFGKTRKECSHGETCLLARNALEYWLHPDKYRTILCGHGEACNRNICFFAHNQQELRNPSSMFRGSLVPGELPLSATDLAADALQQLSLAPHAGAMAGSSSAGSSAAGAQQLLYMPAAAGSSSSAVLAYQHRMGAGSSSGGSLAGAQQPMQAVQVVTPTGQQQMPVPVAVATNEQQQLGPGLSPSATPGIQQLAYQAPGIMMLGQQQYVQAPAGQQPLLLHQQHPQRQHHRHHGSYEHQLQPDDVSPQQLVMWQGLDPNAAVAPGADPSNPGGMVLLQQPQHPMPVAMSSAQGWGDPSGIPVTSAAGYMPYYALPLASMTAGSHMMLGAGGTQQQQQQPTPAQLVHMQQQQQHQHMLVYAPPGVPGAAAARVGSSAGAPVQYVLPSQAAAAAGIAGRAVHVPASPRPQFTHEQSGGYIVPSATAAADASHFQLPPTGQW